MKIVGAGWGRTGTTSATAALERLGAGPCLHMKKMFDRPDLAALFARPAVEVDWAAELAEFESGVNWPACWVWRELARAYPEAPVLLTTRDPEKWHASVMSTIHPRTGPTAELPPFMRPVLTRIWDEDFGGWRAAADRDHAIACFEAHNEAVRREVPTGRLVEWRVEDGWGPLAVALGVPVPEEEFPHLNSRQDFGSR